MRGDYIPRGDEEFMTWALNFSNALTANPTAVGETSATATAVGAAVGNFQSEYMNFQAMAGPFESQRELKDSMRDTAEDIIRATVRRVQVDPNTTDPARVALGITVPGDFATPDGLPASHPVLAIDTSERLRHTISFRDAATPDSRARPAGMRGCEIWSKVGGTPPTTHHDCEYLALDSASPYVAIYESGEAGQTVYYMGRWVNTRGEPGPWSETVGA